jgi:hypothetical protein
MWWEKPRDIFLLNLPLSTIMGLKVSSLKQYLEVIATSIKNTYILGYNINSLAWIPTKTNKGLTKWGWPTKQLERKSNDRHQSISSSCRQEQHTEISSRSDNKRSSNLWRKWLSRKLYFSPPLTVWSNLFTKLISFLCMSRLNYKPTPLFFSFSLLVASHAQCVTCFFANRNRGSCLYFFWLTKVGPPRRRDHPTNLPLPTRWGAPPSPLSFYKFQAFA